MKLTTQTLEEFLDQALPPQEQSQVAAQVASDPDLARRVSNLKSQRQLRAAALKAYQPDASEAASFSRACVQAMRHKEYAPLARIGLAIRRSGLVAACLAIGAGGFFMGRFSAKGSAGPAPATVALNTKPVVPYVVSIEQPNGQTEQRTFTSYQAARRFVTQYSAQQTWVADASMNNSLSPQGQF